MQTLDAILNRRSIRKYLPKKVPSSAMDTILQSAMAAPSACNQQPWQFIIIDKEELLKEIPKFSPHASMCVHAATSVLVCADTANLISSDFWPQDCAAATQNILLSVCDLGLGAVWTGVFPHMSIVNGFKKLFDLPKHIMPFAYIIIGYPDEKPHARKAFEQAKIHNNGWN